MCDRKYLNAISKQLIRSKRVFQCGNFHMLLQQKMRKVAKLVVGASLLSMSLTSKIDTPSLPKSLYHQNEASPIQSESTWTPSWQYEGLKLADPQQSQQVEAHGGLYNSSTFLDYRIPLDVSVQVPILEKFNLVGHSVTEQSPNIDQTYVQVQRYPQQSSNFIVVQAQQRLGGQVENKQMQVIPNQIQKEDNFGSLDNQN